MSAWPFAVASTSSPAVAAKVLCDDVSQPDRPALVMPARSGCVIPSAVTVMVSSSRTTTPRLAPCGVQLKLGAPELPPFSTTSPPPALTNAAMSAARPCTVAGPPAGVGVDVDDAEAGEALRGELADRDGGDDERAVVPGRREIRPDVQDADAGVADVAEGHVLSSRRPYQGLGRLGEVAVIGLGV